MEASIIVTNLAFRSLSPATQTELLALFGPKPDQEPTVAPLLGAENPPELSPAQARKMIEVGPRTKVALRVIAENNGRFRMRQVMDALGERGESGLRGVWGAITRRGRTVLGDPNAEIIWWAEDGIYKGEKYVDHEGWISDATARSLRQAFRLDG